jgi:hypothetical protein
MYRVSPIGIVEGKYSEKKKLIVDLSSPHDGEEHSSINNLIDKEQWFFENHGKNSHSSVS